MLFQLMFIVEFDPTLNKDYLINIGSGNGLVSSSNEPLLGPLPMQIYVAIYSNYARMS